MPVVSVLMVCHRDTLFLRPAVESVFRQTLPDLELVLVDNGAGLKTESLGPAGRDTRLRVIRLSANQGASVGRNTAFAQSSGEFIALLDYDDIALPERIEKQVALLRAQPRIGMASCLAHSIGREGTISGREFALVDEQDQKTFSNYSMPSPASSCTGRREFFERVPFRTAFDLAEDYDFLARVAEICPIQGVAEVLMQYRHHAEQCSQERMASQVLAACLVRLLTARRRQGRPEELAASLEKVAAWRQHPPAVQEIYAYFAGECLRDGLPLLAAYHARRMLATRIDFRTIVRAAGVVPPAVLRADAEAGRLLRLFFTGPMRAHRLVAA